MRRSSATIPRFGRNTWHWINIGAFTLVGVWLVLAIVRTVRCNKRQKAKIAAK